MNKLYLSTILLATLIGCSNTNYYILSDVKDQKILKRSHTSIGVERVEVPKYLFKRELATATSTNEIVFHPQSQWAEDMDEALTRRIIGSLQKRWNNPNIYTYPWGVDQQPHLTLHINITRFIAKQNKVYIDANYRITNTQTSKSVAYLFTYHIPIQQPNDANIIASMDQAIEYLISDIANKLSSNL